MSVQAIRFTLALLIIATCRNAARAEAAPLAELPVVFTADFETGGLEAWSPTDARAWAIVEAEGNHFLALQKQSKYKPEVRSPVNLSLINDVCVGSFVLELKMHSTTKDYGHRDLCLFFGHQDATHFYYVHIANRSDPHANSIFIVDGEPRVSIAEKRTAGTKWDEKWHTVRLVRDVEAGTIQVYFDDMEKPIMSAKNDKFKWGQVGVGSFDDTGEYDDLVLRGQNVEPPK